MGVLEKGFNKCLTQQFNLKSLDSSPTRRTLGSRIPRGFLNIRDVRIGWTRLHNKKSRPKIFCREVTGGYYRENLQLEGCCFRLTKEGRSTRGTEVEDIQDNTKDPTEERLNKIKRFRINKWSPLSIEIGNHMESKSYRKDS